MRFFYSLFTAGLLLAASVLTVDAQEAAPVRKATRQQVVTGAKNMVVRTSKATYYYLVSNDFSPVMHMGSGTVTIGSDEFERTSITGIRFRSLPHVFLDEDSTTYYRAGSYDHAALALRRTFDLGRWNSLVLPFDLTGTQLRYAFGDDAELAQPRAITDEGEVTLEFTTLDLQTDDVVLRAGYHYQLRPTREPDVAATARMYSFLDERPYGPIYFIPNVTKAANQTARLQTVQNADASRKVRFHGTFLRLDGTDRSGTVVRNKKVAPGMYYLNADGRMAFSDDSLTVQAFRSWIQDVSSDPVPLRFYIDGVGEDITAAADALQTIPEALGLTRRETAVYTISGRRIDNSKLSSGKLPRGIYIINGRKVVVDN